MSNAGPWVYWALLSAMFAALTAVFAKIGLAEVNPDLATLIRTIVILVVLTAFIHFSGQWPDSVAIPRKAWLFLILSGLTTGASWICYFRALQIGDASKVAPIDKLSVVLVAVFAVIFLGERPNPRDWTGILLVGAGVLLLAIRR
jgi:bacterial/archaeal transporter family protein